MIRPKHVSTFLWYDDQAEPAADLYTSLVDGARVTDVMRRGPGGPVLTVDFELAGQRFTALNGGPHYRLSPAVSIAVTLDSQDEIDRLWNGLLEGGGQPTQCGWLVDRFGLSWQVVPSVLTRLLADPDPARAGRAMQAMLGMQKLDVAALERAHAGV